MRQFKADVHVILAGHKRVFSGVCLAQRSRRYGESEAGGGAI